MKVCCTKTYKEDTVPDDISVGNMVSIINTECTYELAYETKEVKEKKDTKRKGMISFIDDDTTSCKYVKITMTYLKEPECVERML